ncbi:hypothetical protein D9O50_02520 [Oxalobacteraceae bacterium CAVE-383]|nr:hypothetical protein D9O50_02520 [Oxalobacteraceae bacterium CAVE-383]
MDEKKTTAVGRGFRYLKWVQPLKETLKVNTTRNKLREYAVLVQSDFMVMIFEFLLERSACRPLTQARVIHPRIKFIPEIDLQKYVKKYFRN